MAPVDAVKVAYGQHHPARQLTDLFDIFNDPHLRFPTD